MIVRPLPPAELDRLRDPEAGLGALATERGNLPLEAIELAAAVTGLLARTTLTQTFANAFGEPLEATYIFPLPPRAAVTAFTLKVADRVVTGTLAERGQARQTYERAIEAGQQAAIAEQERPDVFTVRVGNLPPGERAVVSLELVGQLPWVDGAATYRFPLVVAPRYIPGTPLPDAPAGAGTSTDTDAVPDASRITPPVLLPGFPNPVRLAATVSIDPGGLPMGEVTASLPASAGEGDGPLVLDFAPGQAPDRDLVVRWALGAAAVASALTVEPDEDGAERGTFALTVLPPAADPAAAGPPRDVVLVLDRSGSMAGWKMVAARRAAARMVDGLGERDRFAVLGFDNVVEQPPGLPAGSLVPATDRHRFRSVEFLAGLESRGGTEMAAPLAGALDLLAPGDAGRDRVLVLVTDGQVGNEDQLLARLTPRLGGVRVFTVGIDRAVNEGFLDRLAAGAGGAFELVESEDRLDAVMDRIHRRMGSPVVTDLAIDTGAGPGRLAIDAASVAPARLPDLFEGAPVVVTGRWSGPGAAGATLAVAGRRPDGGHWRATVPARTGAGGAVAPVWAKARLRDLEDRWAVAGDDELEREIVATSLRWGVLSRFTAFVAVDSQVVNEGGRQRTITQPVHAPSGWELDQPVRAIVPFMAQAEAAPAAANVLRRFPKPVKAKDQRGKDSGLPRGPRGWIDLLGQAGPEGPRPTAPQAPGAEQAAGSARPEPAGPPAEALRRLRELRELRELLERGPSGDLAGALRALVDALAALLAALTLAGGGQAREVAELHERAAGLLAAAPAGPDRAALEPLWAEAGALAGRLGDQAAAGGPGRAFWRRRPR